MGHEIQNIPLLNLSLSFIPVLFALAILFKWSLSSSNALYALARMLVQLLLVGYLLSYIFDADNAAIVITVLAIMVFASSWIALGTIPIERRTLYKYAFLSIALGGGFTLLIITQGVLNLDPWYLPQLIIPLAGMIFANAMNSVSLAAERMNAEIDRNVLYMEARHIALHASLIPVINSLFAVGLVSLPGMMTGQILSGVSPLIAVRYQIMVMCMIFASSVLSTAFFLVLAKPTFSAKLTKSR
jgi:putative ABC transport system permease protein